MQNLNHNYHNVYSERDEKTIQSHIAAKDASDEKLKASKVESDEDNLKVKKLKADEKTCDKNIDHLKKLKHPSPLETANLAAEQKNKARIQAELASAQAEANAAKDKADQAQQKETDANSASNADKQKARGHVYQPTETTTITQPDLLYTLPGDVIIYDVVAKNEGTIDDAGHIDIRTYHGFASDFSSKWPLPALGSSSGKVYQVIGVFRKISDTMAMVRVHAFLRIIREYAVGETSLADKERSYKVLSYEKGDGKGKKDVIVEMNDLKVHPSNLTSDKKAGAYQLRYSVWFNAIKRMGWPNTFEKDMQERVAMYLLQSTPTLNVDDTHAPRRSALGYIMENKLEKALKQESQTDDDLTLIELYPFLPGGENQQLDMDALDKKFKQYVDDQCKKLAN